MGVIRSTSLKRFLVVGAALFACQTLSGADCPKRIASLTAKLVSQNVPDAILDFLKRFRALPLHQLSDGQYLRLMEQLGKIDFATDLKPQIVLMAEAEGRKHVRTLEIDPLLIQGWRKLGFIGQGDRWNFNLSFAEAQKRFEQATGLRLIDRRATRYVSVKHDKNKSLPVAIHRGQLQPHEAYVKAILAGEYHFNELHDLLFHGPWLIDPQNRKFLTLAGRFDLLVDVEEPGRHSFLNSLFEYSAAREHHEKYLMGILQLFDPLIVGRKYEEISFESTLRTLKWQQENPEHYTRERHAKPARVYQGVSVFHPQTHSWYLALLHMSNELRFRLSERDLPFCFSSKVKKEAAENLKKEMDDFLVILKRSDPALR